ncbi:MAG: histidine phosphatase family protein [Marinobacterium sp.]|nr:histidine phosphatase family protein [Marinobacterium sp.]
MKQLTLIRHAKSSWGDPSLSDFDRPLNQRGTRDLPGMAHRVSQHLPAAELILSSRAQRAQITAEEVAGYQPGSTITFVPEMYESCYETLLNILQSQSDTHQHLILVGHNPGLKALGYYLTHEQLEKFPTSAVQHIHLSVRSWSEIAECCGTLSWFDCPKKHLPYCK